MIALVRRVAFSALSCGLSGAVSAQVPVLPDVPSALPAEVRRPLDAMRAPVEVLRKAILDDGARHNARCTSVRAETPEALECAASRQQILARIKELGEATDHLDHEITAAVAAEHKRLVARDSALTLAITRDIREIKTLGFDRRAEDFVAWEKLGKDGQAQFTKQLTDAATDLVIERVRSNLLDGFKSFDQTKAARWVGKLNKVNPKPVELIGIIERVGRARDKSKIVADAEVILDKIELLQTLREAESREDILLLGLDLICDVVPPPGNISCNAYKTTGKLAAAAAYSSVSWLVAVHEVERLTTMNEQALRALAKLTDLLVRHVSERNEVQARIRELAISPTTRQ